MTLNNIRINTWTPWTPWTPFHSVKKYFKKNSGYEEYIQNKKDLIKKIFYFYWSKGVSTLSTLSGMIIEGE